MRQQLIRVAVAVLYPQPGDPNDSNLAAYPDDIIPGELDVSVCCTVYAACCMLHAACLCCIMANAMHPKRQAGRLGANMLPNWFDQLRSK